MSLDLTFVSISHEDASQLIADPTSVDDFVRRERGFKDRMVLTGRWDALQDVLDGAGFRSSHFIDEVLSNGCEVVEAELVFRQAEELRRVDQARVQEQLRQALPNASVLAEQAKAVPELVNFYLRASSQALAVVFFAQ